MRRVARDMEEILRLALERIRSVVQPRKVILLGSVARGDNAPDSDIDLLVVVQSGTHRRRTAQEVYRGLVGLGHAIDLVVVTEDDMLRHTDNSGVVIGQALSEGRVPYAA
jgi:uncharacterized protein